MVNTNNGLKAQNKHFKYDYLPRSVDKTVFDIAVLLVKSFIPDAYQHYVGTNLKHSSFYRGFDNRTPSYLHNRPAHVIKHCMKSTFDAGELHESDVYCLHISNGKFKVQGTGDVKVEFTVKLQAPSCTREEWLKTHFPCKHFHETTAIISFKCVYYTQLYWIHCSRAAGSYKRDKKQ